MEAIGQNPIQLGECGELVRGCAFLKLSEWEAGGVLARTGVLGAEREMRSHRGNSGVYLYY